MKLYARTVCRDSPCGGCFFSKKTCFRHRCTPAVEEAGSRRGEQGALRAACGGAAGARAAPSPDPSGRSRCPAAPGCAPSAARPSSSSPWPPAGARRRSRPAGRGRRRARVPSPAPSGRRGCGCVCPPCPCSARHLLCGRGRARGAGGRQSRGCCRCGRCCSTRHRSWRRRRRGRGEGGGAGRTTSGCCSQNFNVELKALSRPPFQFKTRLRFSFKPVQPHTQTHTTLNTQCFQRILICVRLTVGLISISKKIRKK